MDRELRAGRRVELISWGGADNPVVEVGHFGCVELEIVLEKGPFDFVPYVKSTHENGTICLLACHTAQMIRFADETPATTKGDRES